MLGTIATVDDDDGSKCVEVYSWFARIPACTSTFPKEAREYLDKCKTTGEYMPTVASLTVDSQNPWQLPADDLKVWIKLPLPNRLQSMLRSGVVRC